MKDPSDQAGRSAGGEHVGVLIVGAGLSGIGAAHHLQRECPDRSYLILEGRDAIGGTWDLFRYPGIRSDSDMHTLGYAFRPWTGDKAIADGATIRDYIRDTARDGGIEQHIRFDHRAVSADWSTADARWTVLAIANGAERRFTCDFLWVCSGYYDYAGGYTPEFAGTAEYRGRIVHPQAWPDDLDYQGQRVVVIGSGATAVTLVPELAKRAAHVTMLQRSPSYVVARPSRDWLADWLRRRLPARAAYRATRAKNVALGQFFYRLARRRPEQVRTRLLAMVRDQLGPEYDVGTHFTPRYNPWDQRICLVPDGDLFAAIKAGSASVVTGRIDRFTATGIRLEGSEELPADIVVTATGLELQLMGGIALSLDGVAADPAKSLNYKGMMYSDIPNLASTFGYTNASWTLKADLTAGYVSRLLNTMRRRGVRQCTPRPTGAIEDEPMIDFTSGYVQRGIGRFPRQGKVAPWRVHQNYWRDLLALRFGSVDRDMAFTNPVTPDRRRAG